MQKNKTLPLAAFALLIANVCGCASYSKKETATTAVPKILWTASDPSIQNPESAYYDEESKALYVSNVAGEAMKKDKKGWITKIDAVTGKIIQAKWVTGLNAPKGIRVTKGILWVSDIDRLVAIDVKTAKITRRLPIVGAQFLNDVNVGPNGEIYVSDMMTGNIHVFDGKSVSLFTKDADGELPNGIVTDGKSLFVSTWGIGMQPDFSSKTLGNIVAYDLKTKVKSLVTRNSFGNLDGLEFDDHGGYFVSDWMNGKVYRVDQKGGVSLLIQGEQGTADLAYLPKVNVLIIPQMMKNQITAYQL